MRAMVTSRPDRPGPGRGRRRVPRADRAAPPRTPGALLPDARIAPGCRGRPPRDAAGRLAGHRRVRGTRLAAHLALPDRHQPLPQRASLGQPTPGQAVGRARGSNRPSRPGSARSSGSSRIPTPSSTASIDVPLGPEARYEQRESISLAFVTALQLLPPRQLAVLVLRDVLGFHASEVAEMLDSTVESVNSALKRARASLQRRWPRASPRTAVPRPARRAEDAVVAKFVRAWESADLDALVTLLTDDVFMSMPPMPFEYEGRDVVARFCASIFARRPQVRPRPDAGQRSAGVRRLPARPQRHQPRSRPLRPHPRRRSDLRDDPLRERRAPLLRAPAFTARSVSTVRVRL